MTNLLCSYDLKGRDAGKFLARRKVRKHQHQHFLFHQRGQDLWVPIKKSHDYLGTVIAYRDAQSKTVTHRLKKARGQYSQLRKTINSARIVSNRPRYHIWRAGVLSAATYGLLSVGVTGTSKRSLQAMASRQMRAIARRPAHLTHLTNAQVRQALNAEEPLARCMHRERNICRSLMRWPDCSRTISEARSPPVCSSNMHLARYSQNQSHPQAGCLLRPRRPVGFNVSIVIRSMTH